MKYVSVLLSLVFLTACTTTLPITTSPTPTVDITSSEKPVPTLPSPTTAQTANPKLTPVITQPQPNTKITSPLTISGSVPPGWMFEGSAIAKLADSEGNNITTASIKEKDPGSWQSGNLVDFTATVTFQTTAQDGFLIIEADNPSGLPENAKSFMIPVKF